MNKAKYLVFLKTPIDAGLKSLLSGYIAKESELEFLLCSEWEQNGMFIYLKAVGNQPDQHWGINIPINTVLAVADFSEQKNIGFTNSRKINVGN